MTAAVDALALWRDNPVSFVRDNFGIEPDEWQRDALTAVAQCNVRQVRLAMKASKGAVCSLRPSPPSKANRVTLPPVFFTSMRLTMACSW